MKVKSIAYWKLASVNVNIWCFERYDLFRGGSHF